METSITKEQARVRRKHFVCHNSGPFYTMSYKSKVAAQDENVQPPLHDTEAPNKETPTKELATA